MSASLVGSEMCIRDSLPAPLPPAETSLASPHSAPRRWQALGTCTASAKWAATRGYQRFLR
eukprot:9388734-Alexandrium_andersonii.AAC.1